MSFEQLGDKMKAFELASRTTLPARSFIVIRLDGKAFHTYTRGFTKPFDDALVQAMAYATKALCSEIGGASFGYCQSDEISILLPPGSKLHSEVWYGGQIQKIVSVSASIATAYFNEFMSENKPGKHAFFDSRVLALPLYEVADYFIWRQTDAIRNSISMLAQANFSHRELHKKSQQDMKRMLKDIGKPWAEIPTAYKRGTSCRKEIFQVEVPENWRQDVSVVDRSIWVTNLETPDFYDNRDYITETFLTYEQIQERLGNDNSENIPPVNGG